MKLKDARGEYSAFSGKASDVARQLAFAAIAVVWVFKSEHGGVIKVPSMLIWPAAFAVGSLTCDLLQYVYASAAWGFYHRLREKQNADEETEFLAPRAINWPTILFFWLKLGLTAVTYISLLAFLGRTLR